MAPSYDVECFRASLRLLTCACLAQLLASSASLPSLSGSAFVIVQTGSPDGRFARSHGSLHTANRRRINLTHSDEVKMAADRKSSAFGKSAEMHAKISVVNTRFRNRFTILSSTPVCSFLFAWSCMLLQRAAPASHRSLYVSHWYRIASSG